MKILKVGIYIFFCLLLMVFLGIAFLSTDNGISLFDKSFVCILTDSMDGDRDDSIKTGSLIINNTKFTADQINENSIITFKMPTSSGYIINTHRVVGTDYLFNQKVFYTQGDNVSVKDYGYRTIDNIVGVYTGVSVPVIGNIFGFLSHIYGLVALIGSFIIVIFTMYLLGKSSKPKSQVAQNSKSYLKAQEAVAEAEEKLRIANLMAEYAKNNPETKEKAELAIARARFMLDTATSRIKRYEHTNEAKTSQA